MSNPGFSTVSALRSLFTVTALVAGALAHGQNVNVTAANASNDAIYSVAFNNNGGGSITVLNTDQGSLHHLVSISFYSNPFTLQLDLLAADNQGGEIVSYPGDFPPGHTTGSPVFTYPSGPQQGPAYPDAMSVDPAGNLFVANSSPGSASNAQLFVLPPNGTGGFSSPLLIDGTTYGAKQTIAETLVVGTTIPA
jgi:hypothetical protein